MISEQDGEKLRQLIIDQAKKGSLNHSPLLTTPHRIVCDNCRTTYNVTYLYYLKNGQFKIGVEDQMEEVYVDMEDDEDIALVVIGFTCEYCGGSVEVVPFTVEYLGAIAAKSSPTKTMWA